MKRRTVALGLAVVLALAATGLVWWYVASLKSEVSKDQNEQIVLVAREDIPARTTGDVVVKQGLVVEQSVARSSIAPGALTAAGQLQGKIIQANLAKGQQIVESQVVAPEAEGLSYGIPNGMRAVSVPVTRVRGVGGTIRPGDRVDVIATFKYEVFNQGNVASGEVLSDGERGRIQSDTGIDLGASKTAVTRTVLSMVEVLRIDPVDEITATENSQGNDDNKAETPDSPVVVLLVTPEDAEKLVFAQEEGVIAFALVPASDEALPETPGRAIINEFSASKQKPVRMNTTDSTDVQTTSAEGK